MKYKVERTQIEGLRHFSHGDNILGEHVDALLDVTIDHWGNESVIFRGKATKEDREKYCK